METTQIFEDNELYIKVKYCLTCFIFLFFIILGGLFNKALFFSQSDRMFLIKK